MITSEQTLTRRPPSGLRPIPAPRALSHAPARPVLPPGPARTVLVGTDGSPAAGAAIRLARLLANAGEWAPQALTVIEPLPVAVPEFGLPDAVGFDPGITEGVIGAVKKQVRRLGSTDWTVKTQFGGTAASIVSQAHADDARLIVLGLGRHGKLARVFGAETAARVCRLSDIPVLAVDAGLRRRPHTILVAMDFGDSSVRAAREALTLLDRPGRLHLVHVRFAAQGMQTDPAWERTYSLGVERAFQRLCQELRPEQGVRITSQLSRGSMVESILEVASAINADVIAAGSHSQTVVNRLLLGSTPSHLLRAAPCSVLIAPPVL